MYPYRNSLYLLNISYGDIDTIASGFSAHSNKRINILIIATSKAPDCRRARIPQNREQVTACT